MNHLFSPIRFGAIEAANRVIMAPLTRGRADGGGVPQAVMVDYYRQRASAGLIISEATGITRDGLGWVNAPGIWSDAQVDAWQPVTRAVHDAGGRIVMQLWHMGRLCHPDFTGKQPVSASGIIAPGVVPVPGGTKKAFAEPRALDADEIPELVNDYVAAARRAVHVGFDGVEIHAANGYLLDQFLRDSANRRTDRYGGPIANRMRLLLEVVDAVGRAIGAGRVGVRLSPHSTIYGVCDSDPEGLLSAVAGALGERGIAYLHVREPQPGALCGAAPAIRGAFTGPLILNGGYDARNAAEAVASSKADAIAFGRPFIANPDLVRRIADGLPIAEPDAATLYSSGPAGYTDYPAWGA